MILLNLDFTQYLGLNRKIMKTLICTATSLELSGIFPSISSSEIETADSGFEKEGISFFRIGGQLNRGTESDRIGGHHTYFLPFLGFRPGLLGLSNLPIDFSRRVKNPSLPRGRPVRSCCCNIFISSSEVDKLRNSFQSSIIS